VAVFGEVYLHSSYLLVGNILEQQNKTIILMFFKTHIQVGYMSGK